MFRPKPLVILCALALAACTSPASPSAPGAASTTAPAPAAAGDAAYAVVTHGGTGDAFWDVVKNGAEAAGTELGVTVTYEGDGDPQRQSQLIDAAVNKKVNGIVVSMANPDALRAAIQGAVQAGIPVITINSGQDKSAEFGAITHVGQDERVAGQGAGGKLKEAGVTKLVCVVHEAGNVGLEQRCEGAKETLGGTVENLQVDINNLQEAQSTIQSRLQADTSLDGVLALNPAVGAAAVGAVKGAGSAAKVATFDLNADVIKSVEAGEILFAVDQQQYLQGYLPVMLLNLYKTNLNVVGGGHPVLTGPGFVTKENAAQVAELTGKGTR
ncbi:sugar ABC transporter substrate-binding protein [Acrocarpospora phusangensis]|uniref:Sugar ABC transporter substrate-binding protein n=1 Tax=Acrocarpospora phusangensis TaxID=1070424 RepID=A0A919UNP9_9ACTN|nr:sugar ABC transporter substrate-binding protein [Acrocarpospora phusangensis]GIH22895.1 sugar ABC transporter substrate-binding protein [Acrocarpospora phusangensis]